MAPCAYKRQLGFSWGNRRFTPLWPPDSHSVTDDYLKVPRLGDTAYPFSMGGKSSFISFFHIILIPDCQRVGGGLHGHTALPTPSPHAPLFKSFSHLTASRTVGHLTPSSPSSPLSYASRVKGTSPVSPKLSIQQTKGGRTLVTPQHSSPAGVIMTSVGHHSPQQSSTLKPDLTCADVAAHKPVLQPSSNELPSRKLTPVVPVVPVDKDSQHCEISGAHNNVKGGQRAKREQTQCSYTSNWYAVLIGRSPGVFEDRYDPFSQRNRHILTSCW